MPFSKRANLGTISLIKHTKKLTARFFVGVGGAKPVREWIMQLSDEDRRVIGADIQKVEFGWPIGRPHCAPLGHGLWEVRSAFAGGRIARVIFCMQAGEMVLLHAFAKKTQAVAQQDLALAMKRKREMEQ